MATSAFDEATAATAAGEGRYDVLPDERFAVVTPSGDGQPAVNGGVLLASMLRGVLAESVHPHPVATSAHFLRVPRIAPAQVLVSWLKQGRTTAVARAVLVQGDKTLIDATVTTGTVATGTVATGTVATGTVTTGTVATGTVATGTVTTGTVATGTVAGQRAAAADGPSWTGEPPALPPMGECVELKASRGISAQVDLRLDPATAGWLNRAPAGIPEIRGYFSLRDDRDPDAYLLAFAVDAMPPVVFGLGAIGWAPTAELTWYMRAVPAAGPLRLAARSRQVSGGWFDEESEVWDSAGRLVAQSRQLALIGRPSGPPRSRGA